jgi:hypothetical protein
MRPSLNPFIGRYQDGGATQVGPDEIAAEDFGDRFYPGYVARVKGANAPGLFDALQDKAAQMRRDMPHPIQYTRPEPRRPYYDGSTNPDDQIGKFLDRRTPGYQEGGHGIPAYQEGGSINQPDYSYLPDISPYQSAQSANYATLIPRFIYHTVEAGKTQPGSEEAREAYKPVAGETAELGLNTLTGARGMPRGGLGSFVGEYGARAMENMGVNRPHPTIAKEFKGTMLGKDPESMASIQGIRDEQALQELNMRRSVGVHRDNDVFGKSGWSLYGNKPIKEVPDTGTKLKRIEGTDYYDIQHPAKLPEIYDIPPIRIDRKLGPGGGQYDRTTGQITLGSPNVGVALKQMQHAIAEREGLPSGRGGPGAEGHYFPGYNLPRYQRDIIEEAGRRTGAPVSEQGRHILRTTPSDPETAAELAHVHGAGENLAGNVMYRYQKPARYLRHPEETEMISRGLQTQGAEDPLRIERNFSPRFNFERASGGRAGFADGGFNKGFNPMKAMSIALSRDASGGLLKGLSGGRTDNMNVNVPQGAYIIPADIVSGMGQGNTDAGGAILGKLMNRGPYNMSLPRSKAGSRAGFRHSSKGFVPKVPLASGGVAQAGKKTPIVAAAGEYVVHPSDVATLGHGDIDLGHDILDAFVKHQREKNIHTLHKLPGPKGAKKK